MTKRRFLILLISFGMTGVCFSQLSKNSTWEKKLKGLYDVRLNVAYCPVDTINDRLDCYIPKGTEGPAPVLMWIHGGGWNRLSKDSVSGQIVPFLARGWVVVNVDYRLASVALAPAAVEDCRAALRWIYTNAKEIKADTKRIVVSGSSAGGHLALMTGMLPMGTSLDALAPGSEPMRVAAIVSFYGITDVSDLVEAANRRGYAIKWLGNQSNRSEIAKLVSPLSYVRPGLPPILSIQGDADPTVPYSHSVRLREALTKAGVPNELMTIPGGKHGKFTKEQNAEIRNNVMAFLQQYGIIQSK